MKKDKNIELEIADVLIEKPHPFSVGHRHFCLYPVTLAKMQLLGRLVEQLEVSQALLRRNVIFEMLRLAKEKKELCCSIIAIHTLPNSYDSLFDYEERDERAAFFCKEFTEEDVASLLAMVFSADKTSHYMHHLGIDKEQDKLRRVMKVKSDKGNLSFGGLSLFGSFIYPLKEMGYTDREILYEKGYVFLRLMLADKPTSVFLSEDERKKIPKGILNKSEDLILPTKENMKTIMSMDWK